MATASKRRKHDNKSKSLLHIAVVCSSNMNRSMEAHAFLSKKGYNVDSYGTGDKVKLPGPTADKPNVYEFGTTYEEIYTDLSKRDKVLYIQNGILNMLDRNRRIKKGPQRLQDTKKKYDIIFTADDRVYDQVLEHFSSDSCSISNQPVHVINLDIQVYILASNIGNELSTIICLFRRLHRLFSIRNNFRFSRITMKKQPLVHS